MKDDCIHNARCRYTYGYYCEDCKTFFHKDSPTYRSTELLSDIWMVLHNINAERSRSGKNIIKEIDDMRNRIGLGEKLRSHKNYEELITEAEKIMSKYKKNSESATIILK